MSDNRHWRERDLAVLWHPCTQMRDHEFLPLTTIRRGLGIWLEDYDGRRYLDAVSSWWVNLFGHCHPHIDQALRRQLGELEHVILAGFSHAPAIELAERLVALAPPGLTRVFYADNGSSAVEVALKMSYHYWRNQGQPSKQRFVTLENGYHGETLGALGVTDIALYRQTYGPLLIQPLVAPSPDAWQRLPDESWEDCARRCFEPMRALIETHAEELCAVIVEPLVQCAGGMRMYHPVYLELLRAACDRCDVHLIADEIAVGFGRTGTLFACEQAGITPDFLCLSKGLTGGYLPLSAVLTHDAVYQAFYADYLSGKAFLHSHSYTGNALACRAALATLELLVDQPTLETNRVKATKISAALERFADHPYVGEVRQTGMIAAVELVARREPRTPIDPRQRFGLQVYRQALARGLLLRPLGNVIYFMPPYVISEDEIDWMAATAFEALEAAVAMQPPCA